MLAISKVAKKIQNEIEHGDAETVVVKIPCKENEEPREFFLGKAKIVLYKI
jgi:hypothetical protein